MNPRAADYFAGGLDRVAALRRACTSWQGTPFCERSAVKGEFGGVDCAGFIGWSFFECGAIPYAITVPPYEVNHAEHSDESKLRAWFDQPEVRARLRLLDEAEPHLDGDLVFPEVGRCEHHLAIRIEDEIYHIARRSGYCAMRRSQLKFHRSRYRLLEPA